MHRKRKFNEISITSDQQGTLNKTVLVDSRLDQNRSVMIIENPDQNNQIESKIKRNSALTVLEEGGR